MTSSPRQRYSRSTSAPMVGVHQPASNIKLHPRPPSIGFVPSVQDYPLLISHSLPSPPSSPLPPLPFPGDTILQDNRPFVLTPNQAYCVAERLKLPFDPRADDDSSLDPAHLYEFVHQVQKLFIAPPPRPTSMSCITIDISPFRNLQELHVSGSQLHVWRPRRELYCCMYPHTQSLFPFRLPQKSEWKKGLGTRLCCMECSTVA